MDCYPTLGLPGSKPSKTMVGKPGLHENSNSQNSLMTKNIGCSSPENRPNDPVGTNPQPGSLHKKSAEKHSQENGEIPSKTTNRKFEEQKPFDNSEPSYHLQKDRNQNLGNMERSELSEDEKQLVAYFEELSREEKVKKKNAISRADVFKIIKKSIHEKSKGSEKKKLEGYDRRHRDVLKFVFKDIIRHVQEQLFPFDTNYKDKIQDTEFKKGLWQLYKTFEKFKDSFETLRSFNNEGIPEIRQFIMFVIAPYGEQYKIGHELRSLSFQDQNGELLEMEELYFNINGVDLTEKRSMILSKNCFMKQFCKGIIQELDSEEYVVQQLREIIKSLEDNNNQ